MMKAFLSSVPLLQGGMTLGSYFIHRNLDLDCIRLGGPPALRDFGPSEKDENHEPFDSTFSDSIW